jgi:hypothetical protein
MHWRLVCLLGPSRIRHASNHRVAGVEDPGAGPLPWCAPLSVRFICIVSSSPGAKPHFISCVLAPGLRALERLRLMGEPTAGMLERLPRDLGSAQAVGGMLVTLASSMTVSRQVHSRDNECDCNHKSKGLCRVYAKTV